MKRLFFLSLLAACEPKIEISLISIADEINPTVDLEFLIEAGDRQAFLRLEKEPLPVAEDIIIPVGFESSPLRVTATAFIGERQVATGTVDLVAGQTEATIRFAVCSNGATEAEELCDDANVTDGDGCDSTCKPTGCNSDVFTPGEVCFSTQNPVVANAAPSDILVEDTDGDQLLDLIASYPDQGRVRIFFGNDNNAFGNFFEVNVGVDARLVSVADLNEDGFFDFVAATQTNFVTFLGRGDGTFSSGQNFFAGADIRGLALADLDGDQFPEQITLDFGQDRVRILPGLGDGTFDLSASTNIPVGVQPVALSIVDIDLDSDFDILSLNFEGNISVVINSTGTLAPATQVPTNGTPIAITTADFDGDGLIDIAVTKQTGGDFVSIFTQRPNTQPIEFQPGGEFTTPTNPRGLIATDVDLDGDFDIAFTSESDSNVTILVNDGTAQFAPAEAPIATTTGPKAITTGDINRDGIPDFVTAGQDLGLIFSTP